MQTIVDVLGGGHKGQGQGQDQGRGIVLIQGHDLAADQDHHQGQSQDLSRQIVVVDRTIIKNEHTANENVTEAKVIENPAVGLEKDQQLMTRVSLVIESRKGEKVNIGIEVVVEVHMTHTTKVM